MSIETNEHTVSLEITNSNTTEVSLHLEPWGERYPLPPGTSLVIVAKGLQPGLPQLEVIDNANIIFYPWLGATASVFQNDTELSPPRDMNTWHAT
jgi:hypothetical protein